MMQSPYLIFGLANVLMLVTLYFSSLPYLYAKSPISVCHYIHKPLSFMAFCNWKIFKTLKIYENGFYAREVLAAAFFGKKPHSIGFSGGPMGLRW
jgi:hypothetical protein